MKSSKSTTPSIQTSSETSHMDNFDEENTNTSTSTNCFDFSLLRKPIVTSVTGFPEAKKAYDNGTEEVCIVQLLSKYFQNYHCNN